MSNINVGMPGNLRYGTIGITSAAAGTGTANVVLDIVDGSIEIEEPGCDSEVNMDLGVMGDDVQMDDRPAKIRFKVKVGPAAFDASELALALNPGFASGKRTLFGLIVTRPDYRGATTGVTRTYTNCRCPDGYKFVQKAGKGFDELSFEVESLAASSPSTAWVTYPTP